MKIEQLPIRKLVQNSGQIEGLPKNPRTIRDKRFDALVKSLADDPEMLQLRELIVFPYGKLFVVIGGNMRLAAASDLGFSEMPCKVLPADTPLEKLKAYTIKDNVSFGDDDLDLLTAWDDEDLMDFGYDFGIDTNFDSKPKIKNPAPGEQVNDPNAEFDEYGDFEFQNGNAKPFKSINMHFETEDDLNEFNDITGLDISPSSKFSYYPKRADVPYPKIYDGQESTNIHTD